MYNISVFENKKKELERKQKEEKLNKLLEEKRKSKYIILIKEKLPSLIENYDKRIKDFIFEV